MNSRNRGLMNIHIAVLLFGLTALFGRYVSLPAPYIVLGRVFFASLSMGIYFLIKGHNICLSKKADYIVICSIGALLAFHWTAFYTSVQVSTVAIALITFSAYPIFVTFFEPLMFRERLKKADAFFALIMFMGVLIIVPELNIENNLTVGLLWGLAGSVSFAVMSLLNRKFASSYDGSVIAFYEQGVAALVLMPMIFFHRPAVDAWDWGLLILLGVVFTGVAHSLFIGGMKHIRAQTAGVIASLETVYGILSAALVLGEVPSARELAGGALILGMAVCSTLKSSKEG